ncbi:MAG: apolipoprotein N-acyltransferase [Candidatus Eisenbacteria bacterium]
MSGGGEPGRARQYLLLVAGGATLALAFPPVDFVPAAFLALVPLLYVLRRRKASGLWRAFAPGFIYGLSFFVPLLYWLVFLSSQEMDNPVVMSGPLVLLTVYQAVFLGLFSATAVRVGSSTRVPAWVYVPVLWVAFEQLRSLGVLGFTWGALGYAGAATNPVPAQFASVTGVFGVSFWMALVNVLVLEALFARRRRRALLTVACAVVFVLPWVHGLAVLRSASSEPARTLRVAVVQPNIAAEKKWDAAYKDMSFEVLAALTRLAAVESPDLVVWPETAAPSYLLREPEYLAKVAEAAAQAGAPVLTGCPDLEFDTNTGELLTRNSVLLVAPDGTVSDKYDKIHLVPFGEAIPFETVFPVLERVDFGEADFTPGERRVVFEAGDARFSALICFESIFPRLAREFVDGGAELLVNVTNDVWYGRTSMPFQHAAMACMRSIENRRGLARSANSGVSLVTDPHGRIVSRLGIFERGVIVEDIPLVRETTFYARHGDVFPWAASILALALLALAAVPRQR